MRTSTDFVRLGASAKAKGMKIAQVSVMFSKEKVPPTAAERAQFFAGFNGVRPPVTQVSRVLHTLAQVVSH